MAKRKVARSMACAALFAALAGFSMAFAPVADPLSSANQDTLALRPSLDGPDMPVAPAEAEPASNRHGALGQWRALIREASARFDVPVAWIRAVIGRESGGRICGEGNAPIRSRKGAMGLMQLMPQTYEELRRQYALGNDPYNPHDNIIAGTAYLKWLQARYGYPALFAAYNHGPGNFERHLQTGRALPRETRSYLLAIKAELGLRPARKSAVRQPDLRLVSL